MALTQGTEVVLRRRWVAGAGLLALAGTLAAGLWWGFGDAPAAAPSARATTRSTSALSDIAATVLYCHDGDTCRVAVAGGLWLAVRLAGERGRRGACRGGGRPLSREHRLRADGAIDRRVDGERRLAEPDQAHVGAVGGAAERHVAAAMPASHVALLAAQLAVNRASVFDVVVGDRARGRRRDDGGRPLLLASAREGRRVERERARGDRRSRQRQARARQARGEAGVARFGLKAVVAAEGDRELIERRRDGPGRARGRGRRSAWLRFARIARLGAAADGEERGQETRDEMRLHVSSSRSAPVVTGNSWKLI